MDHIIEWIAGAGMAWVLALEVRLQLIKAKAEKLQDKVDNDAINAKIRAESTDKLRADVAKHLGSS